jgi:hypothetical protein
LNPATFRIPQVATRPVDVVNLKSKNGSVRSAPEVQKVQLIGSGLGQHENGVASYLFDNSHIDGETSCAAKKDRKKSI